jgi:hypothetical protein
MPPFDQLGGGGGGPSVHETRILESLNSSASSLSLPSGFFGAAGAGGLDAESLVALAIVGTVLLVALRTR